MIAPRTFFEVEDRSGEHATAPHVEGATELSTGARDEILVAADRMAALGTLAAGVAHEINNPLTYLLLDLEHVQRRLRALAAADWPGKELSPNDLATFVKSIGRAIEGANRVRQIVRDLTTFSQGDVEHRGLVNVRGVLESSLQMAWHEIRHRARLSKNLAEVPPVDANEARLAQVFLTLLVNAAQAIPEGRADENEVRVSTRADEAGHVIIEISDSGVGIGAEALPRVFDPFFTTKGAGGGTGLGLAVAHGIIKSMDGQLEVVSRQGSGSTFRVILSAARAYRRISSGRMRAVMERRRMLVIEEEALVRAALAQALEGDVDVTSVSSANEGLALMRGDADFDIVLCDLMMPVMSGMDLYVEVVREVPHFAGRIVFMTGGVFTTRAKAFLESVSSPCLEKPIDMHKLRGLLGRW